MAHEHQERYSSLVLAKLRNEQVLKTGVVFNTDYEGSPTAGAVKIPVRDKEVAVSEYDKMNGISPTGGETGYETLVIDRDVAVNEIIDGYDSESVPDNLVADRLDSAGYSLAEAQDADGGAELLAGGEPETVEVLDKNNVYAQIVAVRKKMNTDKIPNDGKRYLLVLPDAMEAVLTSPEFISASNLGDEVKKTGAIGKIAGFNVYEWNDSTPNLAFIAGHPKFATRAEEFSVGVHLQDLSGSGKYIGASAVQGRLVFAHRVLRSKAIKLVYTPGALSVTTAAGSAKGTTVASVTGNGEGTLYYRVNPMTRTKFGDDVTSGGYNELTSGVTEITAGAGAVIEVVEAADGKVVSAGYAHSSPKA